MFSAENNEVRGLKFVEALGMGRGVTAVIGSGGKPSLLNRLAMELRGGGGVILCTTTHMFPPPAMRTLVSADARATARALREDGAVCVGEPMDDGRLCAPAMTMAELAVLADYVIVEADGSKRLPLKAHAAHEPVIPPETSRTVCVVGLSGLGRRVAEVVHRPELFAPSETVVTPELLAEVLNREALADIYYLNQTDLCGEATAKKLASLLHRPAVWGSLRRGEVLC